MIHNRRNLCSKRAFTLVELLVVISIIALLISILLPSLKKARQSAKKAVCTSNARSIAQAGLTYATDDENEQAIPVGEGDGNITKTEAYTAYVGFGGKSGLGPQRDANSSIYGGSNAYLMGSIHRPLNRLIYKNLSAPQVSGGGGGRGGASIDWNADADQPFDIYRCPGDKGFPGMHMKGWRDSRLSGYDFFGTSYAANPYLIGTGQGSGLRSNSIYLRPMSRVPSPSDTVLYSEYAMRYAVFATNPEYNQNHPNWPWAVGDLVAYGHHDQDWHFTTSFGDGHASWVKIRGYGVVESSQWPGSCPKSSCSGILQRGIGWRFDTMPAAPVDTHKIRTANNATLIASQAGNQSWFEVVQ